MENIDHQLANKFWQIHFPELIDDELTERQALDTGFWDKLQVALENADRDTLWSIVFANLPIKFEDTWMYTRIVTTAKRIWHKKSE